MKNNTLLKLKNISVNSNTKKSLGIIKLRKGWNLFKFIGTGNANLCLKSKTLKNIFVGELNTLQSIYFDKNKYAYAYIESYDNSKISELVITNNTKNDLVNEIPKNRNLLVVNNLDDNQYCDYISKNNDYDVYILKQNVYSKYVIKDGYNLFECNYCDFREALMQHKYDNIVFWDYNYESLKAIYKSDYHATNLYFRKFLNKNNYFNYSNNNSIYGCVPAKMSAFYIEELECIKNIFSNLVYSNNCKFIFENEKEKELFEKKLEVKFTNYYYIEGNYNVKKYDIEKTTSQKMRIAIIKEFSEFNKNCLDIDEQLIEKLSKTPMFNNMEITFIGTGIWNNILLKKVLKFDNVSYIEQSIDSDNMRDYLNYDVVINTNKDYINLNMVYNYMANNIPVIINDSNYYNIHVSNNLLIENNDISSIIKILENMEDNKYYSKVVEENNIIIDKILDNNYFKQLNDYIESDSRNYYLESVDNKNPILSVIIPAYNVEKYVSTTIWSLVNHRNYRDIEILAVNDGSKDSTLQVLNCIKKDLFEKETSVLRIIDKPNGGHGSVINVGLENVTGKYVKIVDGDDTLNSYNLAALIDNLRNENVDVVLNNYKEDYISNNSEEPIRFYENLSVNAQEDFEVLCKEKIFNYWGPLLPTATYNVKNLKKRKFLISEKILYDDMEWNFNSIMNVNSVKYYDTYIYHHFIGREGQSITFDGLVKNYRMHRTMTINLINLYLNNEKTLKKYKKRFLYNNYVLKMIATHYRISMNYFNNNRAFREFERELKKYPEFYNNEEVVTKRIKAYRKSHGMIRYFGFILNIFRKIKSLIGR